MTWKCVDCYNQYYFIVLFLQVLVPLMTLFSICIYSTGKPILSRQYSRCNLTLQITLWLTLLCPYKNSPPVLSREHCHSPLYLDVVL